MSGKRHATALYFEILHSCGSLLIFKGYSSGSDWITGIEVNSLRVLSIMPQLNWYYSCFLIKVYLAFCIVHNVFHLLDSLLIVNWAIKRTWNTAVSVIDWTCLFTLDQSYVIALLPDLSSLWINYPGKHTQTASLISRLTLCSTSVSIPFFFPLGWMSISYILLSYTLDITGKSEISRSWMCYFQMEFLYANLFSPL